MNIKKYLPYSLLLISIIITVIMVFKNTDKSNISEKVSEEEDYVFVSKFGSEGTDYGQFGSKLGDNYRVTDKTIENLKNKLSDKKLEQVKKIMEKHETEELSLLLSKLNFNKREYYIILREACIEKPEINGGWVGWWSGPNYITLDKSGNIYVADIYNCRLQKFDSNGNFISDWYNENMQNAIKVDMEGNIYLFDNEEYLHKFNSKGKLIKKLDFRKNGKKYLDYPVGLEIDSKGYFFITDRDNFVKIFDSNGILIKTWPIYNDSFKKIGKDECGFGSSIALDEKGYVYIDVWETPHIFNEISYPIIGTRPHTIYGFGPGIIKYDSSGDYITKWTKKDYSDDVRLVRPMGRISTDCNGHIFIASRSSSCIQKFDTNGNFITKFGSKGSNNGQFLYPEAVAVDKEENVYVMDSGNFRVQKFAIQRKSIFHN